MRPQPGPEPQFLPRYDTANSQSVWQTDSTESGGVIWLAGIDVGTASVTVNQGAAPPLSVGGLSIVDSAITYTSVIFPCHQAPSEPAVGSGCVSGCTT